MTVSLSQIQKVLQNYTKQVQRGTRLKEKESTPQGESTVKARISPEVKRKQVIERVASEIIAHLVNRQYQKGSKNPQEGSPGLQEGPQVRPAGKES